MSMFKSGENMNMHIEEVEVRMDNKKQVHIEEVVIVEEEDGVFENPVFEGSEKRVEIDFDFLSSAARNGLRSVGRKELDELLKLAACEIVSQMSNALFDSYVLSESSLFVYPSKLILKTCGTTRLLRAVPRIVEIGKQLGLKVNKCKYSRASFLFPKHQDEIYHDFEMEVEFLRKTSQYGVKKKQQRSPQQRRVKRSLDEFAASQFFRGDNFVSAQDTTERTGIKDLVPNASIDDFVFEPCGYSMNGLLKGGFVTVHITPEDGFSYASVELCRYPELESNCFGTVQQVVNIFKPRHVVVAVSFDNMADQLTCTQLSLSPSGYNMCGATYQILGGSGSSMWYYSFMKDGIHGYSPLCIRCPRTMERAMASTNSLVKSYWQSSAYDSDTEGSCNSYESDAWDYSVEQSIECVKPKLSVGVQPKIDPKLQQVLLKYAAHEIFDSSDSSIDEFAKKQIEKRGMDLDMFYVFDLGQVIKLYGYWEAAFPRIEVCYAVKCMPDRAMISILAALGAGFDCASESEVDLVVGLGVNADKIVYANACKRIRDIKHAQMRNVNLTTFDTLSELQKMAKWHPRTNLLIRIRADDASARCQLGNKYGVEMDYTEVLLKEAKRLGLNVVGVSFHVGSGATNPHAFGAAISMAYTVFCEAQAMGFMMKVLDIGGGFMPTVVRSSGEVELGGVVEAVNGALERYFPVTSGVRIIAEPGRFFAESAATFAANIYGRRERVDTTSNENKVLMDYWIPDGLYGSFNSLMYDHAVITLRPLPIVSCKEKICGENGITKKEEYCESIVFGPTCDGLDMVVAGKKLPILQNGDWLMFPNMGAYTIAGASNFNGINATDVDVFYVSSHF
eukprot:TRINITY_DN24045_c0_g2_i7.p1 TRINITY_DN24045_c0_g2~~TRINITY_DN24045_c0_g2_i7.p1  ORF type:complete len:847 (+),score=166.78 TRINITY_DN24045_c0_g2_i7:301-2841(+)